MIFIWKGNGILLPIFAFLGAGGGSAFHTFTAGGRFGGAYDGESAARAMLIGVIIGVWVYIGAFGRTKTINVLHAKSGARALVKDSPSLYYIPVKVWAFLITVVCLGSAFVFKPKLDMPAPLGNALDNAAQGGGERALRSAERWVGSLSNDSPQFAGNTPEAKQLARRFGTAVEQFRETAIDGRSSSESSRTYCYLGEDTCAFIIRVPGLRKFTQKAKNTMNNAAWQAAVMLCDESDMKLRRLGVGVRGLSLYSGVLVGSQRPRRPTSTRDSKALISCFSSKPKQNKAGAEAEDPPRWVLPSEMREWESSDGRPLKASLTGFTDDDPPKAVFEREDGKSYTIGLDRFSPSSRQELIAYFKDR